MPRYHPILVAFHWVLALAIVFALAMGTLSLKEIPNTAPAKLFALRGHMIAGMAILALMLVRLGLRLWLPRPAPATTGNRFLDRLAVGVHYGFYVLVILMAASGLATAVQAGLPAIVFGGSGAPLPESFWAYRPRAVHGVVAKLLFGLVALHVAGALYHQLVRRDGLIGRMWFGRRSNVQP
jgi:cytochrome b561